MIFSQILDRCSLVTFAAYLPHKGEAYLFLEAPKGLPDKEKAGKKKKVKLVYGQCGLIVYRECTMYEPLKVRDGCLEGVA